MFVETMNRSFTVIGVIDSNDKTEISICRDLTDDSEQKYLLICIKDMDIVYETISFFTQLKKNKSFTDFVDCFSKNGNFFIVMKYTEKPLLYKQLEQGRYSLEERLEIAKNLLSVITLQDMPRFIQYEALSPENITLDDSLTVNFNYILRDIDNFGTVLENKLEIRLDDVISLLFKEELENKSCKELSEFLDMLVARKLKSYIDIYREYNKVYSVMKYMLSEGTIEPQSFWFKLWEKFKSACRYIRPVLAVLLVLILFGFLVYTIFVPEAQNAYNNGVVFQSIGTVKLV